MLTALLITLREGLEAALVVAVVLSFLDRTGDKSRSRFVWMGAGGAISTSVAAGALLFLALGELSHEVGEVFELAVTLLAVAVLTYMILWMRSHGGEVKSGLERRTRKAVSAASPWALAGLAFAAVGREGLETVLFLFASISVEGAAATILGGAAGFGLAAAAGVALYRGSSRLNLRAFFGVTGILLIVFAAGIVCRELAGAGELGLPAALSAPVWNTSSWLSDESGAGAVLKTMFGYQAAPSPVQISGYLSYVAAMTWLYLRPPARGRLAAAHE